MQCSPHQFTFLTLLINGVKKGQTKIFNRRNVARLFVWLHLLHWRVLEHLSASLYHPGPPTLGEGQLLVPALGPDSWRKKQNKKTKQKEGWRSDVALSMVILFTRRNLTLQTHFWQLLLMCASKNEINIPERMFSLYIFHSTLMLQVLSIFCSK